MSNLTVGSQVRCNGCIGEVVEVHTGDLKGMVTVRLPGGLTTVSVAFVREA